MRIFQKILEKALLSRFDVNLYQSIIKKEGLS
ncbi:hypothetical protein SPYJRS4_1573 [Streptococcus pyogenes JRS4]|uniref:Uncharacterized protein n=1 Tax=Streptococcus pyogenes serotype M12 (strain MGAS9429) TaxID=370551 RepID=Q1JK81_STRPC|nr:hypothetical protein MGAS9429_Spy1555 [Streptococcus pyogenes MGAS9429]BAR45073.1 hypothetical protein SPYJRS4_1573 [Streptococcus pyogenes JRS4]